LAFPQPTVDQILSKLETEIKNEITKATKALAGNLAVSSLEDALFTCLATMEGGRQVYKNTRQTIIVADAAKKFQANGT
jgi:hypothetical protein